MDTGSVVVLLLALLVMAGFVLAHVLVGTGVAWAMWTSRPDERVRLVREVRMNRGVVGYVLLALLIGGFLLAHLLIGAQIRPH